MYMVDNLPVPRLCLPWLIASCGPWSEGVTVASSSSEHSLILNVYWAFTAVPGYTEDAGSEKDHVPASTGI